MKIDNFKKGRLGENIAVKYLKNNGYKILKTNWFYKHKEVDIIAEFNNEIIFIEVKYRESLNKGIPEESLTIRKQKLLVEAANKFIELNKINMSARFDVICIVKGKYLKHYKNAIFPFF